jgi:hypothetical protein
MDIPLPAARLIASAFVSLLCTAPVDAQDLAEPAVGEPSLAEICSGKLKEFTAPPFEVFDTNHDGWISSDEASNCMTLSILFDELDVDDNQLLSRPEYASFAAMWTERDRSLGDVEE